MLRKRRCCGLNFPGVSFSDSTSYETFPRRISKELIRRSRLFFFWTVSLDANASSTNWKLGLSLGVCLFRLMLKPNNCMLLMDILPLNRGEYRIWQKDGSPSAFPCQTGRPGAGRRWWCGSAILCLFAQWKSCCPVWKPVHWQQIQTFVAERMECSATIWYRYTIPIQYRVPSVLFFLAFW